jgi:peptidoglycan hydrolase CwlO-like protein
VRPAPKGSKSLVTVLLAVLIVLAAASGYYYFESSGSIGNLNQTVTSQGSQITIQMEQLGADQAKITNLTGTISTLRTEVDSKETEITSLMISYSQANTSIASLTSQVGTLDSNITALETQISDLNTEISQMNASLLAAESQASQLESVMGLVNSALSSSEAQAIETNDTFSVAAGAKETVPFTPTANGFLLVGVQASTSTNTTVSIAGTDAPFSVGSSGIAVFAVDGGIPYTISVYDGNGGGFSATMNVWYFHS